MNAIVPRQTVEDVVNARNETLALFDEAYTAIAAANIAMKKARDAWRKAAPKLDGNYYEGSREADGYMNLVQLPEIESFRTNLSRIVDITVWQHVIGVSNIEAMMDAQEKEKLRQQMRYQPPRNREVERFLSTLADTVTWLETNGATDDWLKIERVARDFSRDKDSISEMSLPQINEAVGLCRRALSADQDSRLDWVSHSIEDLIKALEDSAALPRGLPEVTVDNIAATLEGLLAQSGEIFMRGIANVFSQLDRRFRSHDGFKIGGRIILNNLMDENGYLSYGRKRDYFVDIERIFRIMDGCKPEEAMVGVYGILDRVENERHGCGYGPKQSEHESAFFRIRVFKNGNAHLWFTRDDLVLKVNKALAAWYGEVIGDGNSAEEDVLKEVKTTPARNYGFFPTPKPAVDKVMDLLTGYFGTQEPLRILEPSAGTGNLARPLAAGFSVDCIEVQPHLAMQLEAERIYNRVTCADFLQVEPRADYDVVIMNPPFDRERDIDHVVHAMKFLKPTGVLVAIMSAGTEFRETRKAVAFRSMIAKLNGRFQDLPERSFAEVGTNVNTITLKVYKDGRKQRW